MILHLFTLILEPENPVKFSIVELRAHLADVPNTYETLHKDNATGFICRYPVVQCKMIKNSIMIIGISQGADLLEEISRGRKKISFGEKSFLITKRDTAVRTGQFGISDTLTTYEFITPWLALNQQNMKKFYKLNGKREGDAFMQKLLAGSLGTLAKSLDHSNPVRITCEANLKFRKDWIDNTGILVFLGKFQTNLRIPDYLGIGQSVSRGFGTIRHIPRSSGHTGEDPLLGDKEMIEISSPQGGQKNAVKSL